MSISMYPSSLAQGQHSRYERIVLQRMAGQGLPSP